MKSSFVSPPSTLLPQRRDDGSTEGCWNRVRESLDAVNVMKILIIIMMLVSIAVQIYSMVSFYREKHELNHTGQRHVTEWVAAFASASSVSLVVDSKANASAAGHVMGMLWPKTGQKKTNTWAFDGDLTAYNWFPGSTLQNVALRNGSGYRWTASSEKFELSSCIARAEMPDFTQLHRINESTSIWKDDECAMLDKTTIAVRVVYDGRPYKITAALDNESLTNGLTVLQIENATMAMQLSMEKDRSDAPGSALGNATSWPNCPQLFDTAE